jgi:glycosyl transferase family 25
MKSIKNIKSFIINLPKYEKKYKRSCQFLTKLDIKPSREEAVYGKDLTDDYIKTITYPSVQYTIKNGRTIDSDIHSNGAIGCYLSHINLWKKLKSSDTDDMFLIFEDDVVLSNSTTLYIIDSFIQKIDENNPDWDMIFLGWMNPLSFLTNKDIPYYTDSLNKTNPSYYKINDINFGTHAYILRKKGAIKLLQNAFPIVNQIDSYISYMASRGDIKAFKNKTSFFNQMNIEGSSIQESTMTSMKPFINRFSNKIIITFYFTFISCMLILLSLLLYFIYTRLI